VLIAPADREKEEDMNLSKMMLVPVFMLAGLATACGDDCVSACEDGKECAEASEEQKAADCDKQCEDGEKLAEKMGCEDEYDDLVSCYSDIDDICKPSETDCATEGAAAFACQLKYCTAHEDDADCGGAD
jgi:hypothetical protein